MKLIKYENYQVTISDEALLVRPIRKLFNADRTTTKEKFMQQMSILFFMIDPRSSYCYIEDLDERYQTILEQEGLPSDTKISKDLQEAMDIYEKLIETPSTMLLKDTRTAVDKVRQFLREFDLNSVDEKGKPIYTLNTIVSAIKQVPQLAKDLVSTQKIIEQEILETGRARGGNDSKKLFEDGISFE